MWDTAMHNDEDTDVTPFTTIDQGIIIVNYADETPTKKKLDQVLFFTGKTKVSLLIEAYPFAKDDEQPIEDQVSAMIDSLGLSKIGYRYPCEQDGVPYTIVEDALSHAPIVIIFPKQMTSMLAALLAVEFKEYAEVGVPRYIADCVDDNKLEIVQIAL